MRVTPWYSTAELREVHGWIYEQPQSVEASKCALGRLEAWLARPGCSSNIECTAALLDAVLNEQASPRPSQRLLRDGYALAIIR
jgi:hypothetical protein